MAISLLLLKFKFHFKYKKMYKPFIQFELFFLTVIKWYFCASSLLIVWPCQALLSFVRDDRICCVVKVDLKYNYQQFIDSTSECKELQTCL